VRALQELSLVIVVLAGAIGGSQVPRFVQEYEQRLGGASQEAGRQLAAYRRVAEATGQPFADYLRRLSGNEDPSVAATGRTIAATEVRATGLGAQAEALERASRLLKPLVLLRRHDPELLRATWARFEPTLTLDPGFAALGVLLGWLLNALLWGLARRRRRGRAPRMDARGLA
jgi:hypothetical protein